jgi:glycosyltransferase involved in cell wall biosynthesis
MIKKSLLFFGDLAPKYLTGTSISSSIILNELQEFYRIQIIEENDNFKYKSFYYYIKYFNILGKCLKLIRYSIKEKFDVFYLVFSVSGFGCLKTLICILSVKLFSPKTQVIIHIHRGDFFTTFYRKYFREIISKVIFKLAGVVILLSKNQLEIFKSFFPRTTFKVLENTIYLERKGFIGNLKKSHKNKFIFISNYFEEKGILDLLSCFEEMIIDGYDIEIDTYGAFSSNELKRRILSYSSNRIRIHESVDGSHKFDIIRNCNCLVLPSWNEGQPLVLLEAMANATPVIATNVGLIPEMLGENYEYLISPRNKQELKEKILTFIKSKNTDQVGEFLYKRYNEFFSNKIHYNKVLEIFKVN